jgi:hypothetical protein
MLGSGFVAVSNRPTMSGKVFLSHPYFYRNVRDPRTKCSNLCGNVYAQDYKIICITETRNYIKVLGILLGRKTYFHSNVDYIFSQGLKCCV